ncbi:MAG: hypothetical protein WC962_09310 [Phycisphaerae bacterium]|jgi:hypothetical protein
MDLNFKIDVSKLKESLGKLSSVGNYSVFIIPIVLIGIAVILLGVNGFLSRRLQAKVEKSSLKLAQTVNSYSSEPISAGQSEIEKKYQDVLEADANNLEKLMIQTTRRELLSYQLFPEPKGTQVELFWQFGQAYRQGIEDMLAQYNAHSGPTAAEMERAVRQSVPGAKAPGTVGGAQKFSLSQLGDVERMIAEEICRSVASNASFSAIPADIPGYLYWDKQRAGLNSAFSYTNSINAVEQCWYFQLGYWIIEDVLKTIGSMNSDCSSVIDCPVKRLAGLDFGKSDQQQSWQIVLPSYVKSFNDSLTVGHTGRVSNEQNDVVQFEFSVIIDRRQVLPFMEELCRVKEHTFKGFSGDEPEQVFRHNQITILEANIQPVNVNDSDNELYRYGDGSIVSLELICEYIFERAGYDEVEPEFIKSPGKEVED